MTKNNGLVRLEGSLMSFEFEIMAKKINLLIY